MRLLGVALVLVLALTAGSSAAQQVRLRAEESLRDVLNAASLLRELRDDEEAKAQDFVAAARADYRRLLTALYSEGYYAGVISITIDGREASDIPPLGGPDRIESIVITVRQGPRFDFGTAVVQPLVPGTELPDGFRRGEVAHSEVIEDAVGSARRAWRNAGHAKVRVADESIVARHPERRLDAVVTLAPGPRLTFGPLLITGNENVRTERIRTIAGLPVGEVYSPEEIDRATARLRRTGAFDSVALTEAEVIGPGNTLPLELTVVEAKPRRFGFGAEVSSVEGLTLTGFWLHRNLLGGAERFRVDAEIDGIDDDIEGTDYAVRAAFNRPATFGPDTDLYARAEVSRQDEPDYLLDKASAEVGLIRRLTDDITLEYGVGLLRAYEESDVGTRHYTLLTFPVAVEGDFRDDPADAQRGWYLEFDADPFTDLEAELYGARFYVDGRGYYSFGTEDRFTFAARTQVGSLWGVEYDEAPADFVFYSGGGGTVRGQPYRSLGVDRVVDGDNVTTGGLSFAGVQLEARVQVRPKIEAVGFYDVGHVGETAMPLEQGEWHAGTGIGVRYLTGIGPIRLDLATPATGENAYEQVQVYIGIGQAF